MVDAVFRDEYPTLWQVVRDSPALEPRAQAELRRYSFRIRLEEARVAVADAREREQFCERQLNQGADAGGIVQGALMCAQALRARAERRVSEYESALAGI